MHNIGQTKTETSLVIWLNIVTIVARSVNLFPAHMREDAQALMGCIVNDGLVNAMANMQQTLLQFTIFVYIKSFIIYKKHLTLVLRFYFYAHLLRLGVKKPPDV